MNGRNPDRAGAVFGAVGKSLCYVGLFLGMQSAVMLPAMVRAAMGGGPYEIYAALEANAVLYTLISGLLTIAVVLAFYLIRRKKLSEALWLRSVPAPTLLAGASLAPALYFVVATVLALLPEAWTENYGEASAGINTASFTGVLAVVFVAPVLEEFIFRGLVMTRLARVMPGWLAVLLSAAMFGVCHGELVWFCYAFLLGAFFGFLDLRAGSVLPSILGHMAFNGIGQILTFVPETEEGTELVIAMGILLLAAVILPVVNRRGIFGLFRPAPEEMPGLDEWAMPTEPGVYEYDPWEE